MRVFCTKECTNTPGGRTCGPCPDGYLGSGETQCAPASTCDTDNGGCDVHTDCSATASGAPVCGDCPAGYTGTGATGCVDEDGCALALAAGSGCYPGVACSDSPAPGSGYTCGGCPVGMLGDGATCYKNACFNANGGCDSRVQCTNAPAEPTGRTCGECPTGYTNVFQDGTRCVDPDGCATAGACFPGVACADVPAPGTGVDCGECPSGYTAAAAGMTPACEDVDECAVENGGCDAVTTCTNTAGGRACGECPEGFMGTGEAGCRRTQTCATDNGGCHTLTNCTDVWDGVECGDCPPGYEGSGYTTCEDIDGCAPSPCFPRVACTDVPAPDVGYTCAGCPEGYKGDGETCDMCTLGLVIQSSTVVEGKVRRAFQNQVIGSLTGLDDAACVPSSETTFQWAGSSSDGALLTLTDEQKLGLRLNFPKATLTTYLSYMVTLSASVTASPEVRAEDSVTFYVEPQALLALVTPSELETGEDSLVVLDAGASYDPDGEAGDMSYEWRCARADASGNCRDRDGALLPTTWTSAVLSLMLEGSPEGVVYIFSLEIHKAGRTASASAQVTMTSGPLPVPTITALPGKVNANQRVVLSSTVESDAPGTVTRAWSVTEEAGTAVLNLSASAATALTGVDLVVRADTLQVGGAYIFKLSVEDSWGPASSSLRVVVNRPPQPGSFTVTPAQGTVLNTTFQMLASDWVDEDNTPLWYQLSYVVTGGTSATQEMLNEYKPDPSTSSMLPEEGLEVAWREVQVFVSVRDALGAVASASAAVVVAPGAELSDTELTSFVDDNLAAGEVAAANGDADTSMLLADGLAAMLNTAANTSRARRRTLLKDAATAAPETELVAARSAQRESMMDLLSGGKASLVPTDSSLERLASSTQKVVATPEELAPALQVRLRGLALRRPLPLPPPEANNSGLEGCYSVLRCGL
ncbi:hypothetical protein CYMTET_4564 [Cymbomonas tetramitiformis]|uniref:EGF-like domain-containing protein n=1 Tax=Cymbomonas tetramitiformis TaxID=36881 RepID=A0AAE0LJS1_9CHLO|nr:hypothetical protein CYMTET_4564 [Cymbomonas tetramitiformis]